MQHHLLDYFCISQKARWSIPILMRRVDLKSLEWTLLYLYPELHQDVVERGVAVDRHELVLALP